MEEALLLYLWQVSRDFFLESSLCGLKMEEGTCPWLRWLGPEEEENSH